MLITKFLLNCFLSNNLYLGYSKDFRNASMLFDIKLMGKNSLDLHNLNHTISTVRKLLVQFNSIWTKFGNIWFILTKLPAAIRYSKAFIFENKKYFKLEKINPILTLWDKGWVSGLLTNKGAFKADGEFKYFPTCLCYLNYTSNSSRFNEANNLKILQVGVADTNANCGVYQYSINANEKSSMSYLFLLKLFLSASYNHMSYTYKNFLIVK